MYVKPNQNYYGVVGIFWRNDIQNFTQTDINFNHTCDCTRCKVEALVLILLIGEYNMVSVEYINILMVM